MTPYYERNGVTIYHGDAREIMPSIGAVDLVVKDPPYIFGIASTFDEGKAGGWGDLMNAATIYSAWLREWWRMIGVPREDAAEALTATRIALDAIRRGLGPP